MSNQPKSRQQRAIQLFVQKRMALALAAAFSMPTMAATVTWDGGGGNSFWDVANNWNQNVLPGALDVVKIGVANVEFGRSGGVNTSISSIDVAVGGSLKIQGKELNIAAASNISQLMMTAGTLTGTGVVSVGRSNLAGIHSGTGTTVLSNGGNHTIGNNLTLSGGRTLRNEGSLTIGRANGDSVVTLDGSSLSGPAAKLQNQNELTIQADAGRTTSVLGGTGAQLINSAKLTKTGAGTGTISSELVNDGQLLVSGGRLILQGRSTHSAGSSFSGAGTLELSAVTTSTPVEHSFADGFSTDIGLLSMSLNSAARMVVDSGTVRVANFTQATGQVKGAGQLILGQASLAGTQTGTGTTVLSNGGNHTIGNNLTLSGGRTLRNEGSLTIGRANGDSVVTLDGSSLSGPAAKLQNQNELTIQADAGRTTSVLGGTGAQLINSAKLTKTGAGTGTISSELVNDGQLLVSGGRLILQGRSTHSAGSSFSGAGTLELSAVTTSTPVEHSFADGFSTDIGLLSMSLNSAARMVVDSGTVRVANFTQATGQVKGAGQLILGQASLAGTQTGTGTTVLSNGGNHTIGNNLTLSGGRTLRNEGSLTIGRANGDSVVTLDGSSLSGPAAKLQNQNELTIQADAGRTTSILGGAGTQLMNSGKLIKVGGGTGSVSAYIANNGEVNVAEGQLTYLGHGGAGPATQLENNGKMIVASGATVYLDNKSLLQNNGQLIGDGTVKTHYASDLAVENHGVISPGSSLGTLHINGAYRQATEGHLDIQIGGSTLGTQYDQLHVDTYAILDGVLDVTHLAGYAPKIGDSFIVLASNRLYGTFSSLALHGFGSGTQINVNYLDGNDADSYADYVRLDVAAVPEPETYAMMLAGLGVVGWSLRKRKLAMH